MWFVAVVGCAPPDEAGTVITAEGEVTWQVTFDETARAGGREDCAYTRTYVGTEDRSTPWLCPSCDLVLLADVAVGSDDLACYQSLTGDTPPASERIGWSGNVFFRSTWPFGPLEASGDRTDEGSGPVAFIGEVGPLTVEGGGTATLTLAGELAVGDAAGDPWHGLRPPGVHRCGWPSAAPPAYDGRWRVAVGKTLPDGWFLDACGEAARLHDFAGRYVVVEVSAMDCPPCQEMAAEETAFLQELRGEGIEVESVTLLAPSLGAPLDPISPTDLALWAGTFGLDSPVLGDRGWGYAMAVTVWPYTMAYPSWFVASPDLEVLAVGQGYDDWDGPRAAVRGHSDR